MCTEEDRAQGRLQQVQSPAFSQSVRDAIQSVFGTDFVQKRANKKKEPLKSASVTALCPVAIGANLADFILYVWKFLFL